MDLNRDIQSLSSFKRNTAEFLKQIKETGEPLVLTINGKAEIVVQDAASYQELLDLRDRFEAIAGIRRGLRSMERGQGQPAEEVINRLRKKHNLPDER
jgi:prevent-host-death family protein